MNRLGRFASTVCKSNQPLYAGLSMQKARTEELTENLRFTLTNVSSDV